MILPEGGDESAVPPPHRWSNWVVFVALVVLLHLYFIVRYFSEPVNALFSSFHSFVPLSTCARMLHRSVRYAGTQCVPLLVERSAAERSAGRRLDRNASTSQQPPLLLFWTPKPIFAQSADDESIPCRISTRRSDVAHAAAIVFHTPSLQTDKLPPPFCGQRWIAWNPNPHKVSLLNLDHRVRMHEQQCADAFDFSATYRLDSSIPYVTAAIAIHFS